MRNVRLSLVLLALSLGGPALRAQVIEPGRPTVGPTTKAVNRPQGISAPVPVLLSTATRVFLSNGGADAGLFPHPFTGTQDRGYGYFYHAISANNRFTLVGSPAEADLVMLLELSSPLGPLGNDKQKGTSDPLPTFKLTIYDRPTHYVLWTITQTVDPANLQKTHDKNFDMSLDSILLQLADVTKP